MILVQREYDEMEETSEILLTQTASHPLLLEKEAEEIVLVEVEVEKETEENVMVNQTPRSNQLLEEEAKEVVMVNQAPSSNQLLEEENEDLVVVEEYTVEAEEYVSISACLIYGKI